MSARVVFLLDETEYAIGGLASSTGRVNVKLAIRGRMAEPVRRWR
jgi:hypothetical protein